jgi:hypothetical protein
LRSSTVMMTMRPPGESCRYTVSPCSMPEHAPRVVITEGRLRIAHC